MLRLRPCYRQAAETLTAVKSQMLRSCPDYGETAETLTAVKSQMLRSRPDFRKTAETLDAQVMPYYHQAELTLTAVKS